MTKRKWRCWRIVRRKWWKFVKSVPQLLRDFDADWDGWWCSVDEAEKRGRHLQVIVMIKDEDWKREGVHFNHFGLWFWSIPQQNQSSKRWCLCQARIYIEVINRKDCQRGTEESKGTESPFWAEPGLTITDGIIVGQNLSQFMCVSISKAVSVMWIFGTGGTYPIFRYLFNEDINTPVHGYKMRWRVCGCRHAKSLNSSTSALFCLRKSIWINPAKN